jgi:acyl-CoA thioesterase I
MKRPHPIAILGTLMLIGAMWQIVSMVWSRPHITNYPPNGNRIVAFGDSLTVGVGASQHESDWVGNIEARLGVHIIRHAVSGDTTALARKRLDLALSEDPDIFIILLGGNDALHRVPQEETRAHLSAIIRAAQNQGAVVLLLGVRGGLLLDHREDLYASLSKEFGTAYVPDVLDEIFGVPALMSDPVHPNDAGYLKMADRIAPALLMIMAPMAMTSP